MTQQARRTGIYQQKKGAAAEAVAARVTEWVGSGKGLMSAVAVVVLWAATGPIFGWSNTWQLVINTGTTIVTFLMVFLVQNSQNRDSAAIQAKLDELIRAIETARGEFIGIEHMTDAEIEEIRSALETECGREFERPPHHALDRLLGRR